jgi:hypothetical protein
MRAQSELLVVLVAPPSIELNQTSYLGGARAARLSIQHDGVNTAVARLTAELEHFPLMLIHNLRVARN